jgi:serine/threonine protein kinase
LAKLLHEEDEPSDPSASTHVVEHLTEAGQRMGTLAYMAPEQASGTPVDARADIFSFGALLYEMATGQRAFAGKTPAETLSAVMQNQPTPRAHTHSAALERTILRVPRGSGETASRQWPTSGSIWRRSRRSRIQAVRLRPRPYGQDRDGYWQPRFSCSWWRLLRPYGGGTPAPRRSRRQRRMRPQSAPSRG